MKKIFLAGSILLFSALAFGASIGRTTAAGTRLVDTNPAEFKAVTTCNQDCLFRYQLCICKVGRYG